MFPGLHEQPSSKIQVKREATATGFSHGGASGYQSLAPIHRRKFQFGHGAETDEGHECN